MTHVTSDLTSVAGEKATAPSAQIEHAALPRETTFGTLDHHHEPVPLALLLIHGYRRLAGLMIAFEADPQL